MNGDLSHFRRVGGRLPTDVTFQIGVVIAFSQLQSVVGGGLTQNIPAEDHRIQQLLPGVEHGDKRP